MINVNPARMKQLAYIGITEDDLSYLRSQKESFVAITNEVVDELYDRIMLQPSLEAIIKQHSTIERLKETQRWYYQSIFEGCIDEEYIERRLFIGKVHSRIGLSTEWYLGTYMLYLDILMKRSHATALWQKSIFTLSKMFNFDSQLVLEAYETDEKMNIQKMVDERQYIITKITGAVQELASMMIELNSSTQTVAETAAHTANLQQQSRGKVEELDRQIKEIDLMSTVIRGISDQTHLLGLNAAIEAARSGEHGLGFQVIANEIRKLANHSKQSLSTIQDRLLAIGNLLHEVKAGSEETTRLSRDQAASSQELHAFVSMIEAVTADLDQLRNG